MTSLMYVNEKTKNNQSRGESKQHNKDGKITILIAERLSINWIYKKNQDDLETFPTK